MRVLHVITGLSAGGAQSALHKLLSQLDPNDFQSQVLSLTNDEPMGARIRALGVQVFTLRAKAGVADPRLLTGARAHILRFQPHVVQTWMYHADLAGGLSAKAAGNRPVVWNIRHTLTRSSDVKPSTLLVARANAILSGWLPKRIVCCASTALESHARLGYRRDRMVVIPNGFDLRVLQPDPIARSEMRHQLALDSNTPLIGMCGRFDPQKDHQSFVRAAAVLHGVIPDAHFVLWGDGITAQNPLLWSWIREQALENYFHLLDYRADSPRINACLDVATLSSAYGEAFPNVIGEAMACGVPCVVTNVGDAAHVVGPTGISVSPRDPQALAEAWATLLKRPEQERVKLGQAARRRVAELFDITQVAQTYAELYQDIIARSRPA